jgi:hypothetical protein
VLTPAPTATRPPTAPTQPPTAAPTTPPPTSPPTAANTFPQLRIYFWAALPAGWDGAGRQASAQATIASALGLDVAAVHVYAYSDQQLSAGQILLVASIIGSTPQCVPFADLVTCAAARLGPAQAGLRMRML